MFWAAVPSVSPFYSWPTCPRGRQRLASLGSGPALRQFGFWLLNRVALAGGEITRPNENGVLALIDPPVRLTSITLGCQLEPWLPEPALELVLASAIKDFQAGRLAEGRRASYENRGMPCATLSAGPLRAGVWLIWALASGLLRDTRCNPRRRGRRSLRRVLRRRREVSAGN